MSLRAYDAFASTGGYMDAPISESAGRAQTAVHAQPLVSCWRWTDCQPLMGEGQATAVLAALGHPIRLRLWCLLLPHGPGGLSAGTISARMSILPSSLSFHLRLMTQAGVLVQRRSSRHIIYAANTELVASLVQMFAALVHDDGQMSQEADGLLGDA